MLTKQNPGDAAIAEGWSEKNEDDYTEWQSKKKLEHSHDAEGGAERRGISRGGNRVC